MTDTTQTTSAPTGQAGAAGNSPATTGETTTVGSTSTAPTAKVSLLGAAPVEKKDAGTEQGHTSGENKTTPEAGAELEVKLPDGITVDQGLLDAFKPVAKEVGLNSEAASKIAGMYAQYQASADKSLTESIAKQNDEWEKQLRADKNVGDFTAFAKNIEKAIVWAGDSQLTAEIHKYGLDNNPVLSKFIAKVGSSLAEDKGSVKSPPGGQGEISEKELLKRLYKNSQG
jgi:hypothetical protein